MLKKIIITGFILGILPILQLAGQSITFRASSKDQVMTGERFQVAYTINAQGTDFRGPGFDGFRVLTGPNPSTSHNYQIINGKMSQSVNLTFTYILQATTEGEYEIPPATINVDGKEYTSNALQVKVINSQAAGSQGGKVSPQGSSNQPSSSQITRSQVEREKVFIKAYVNKRNPYQGEEIIVTYKLYFNVSIKEYNYQKGYSFPGFWSKDLTDEVKQYKEFVDGEEFMVAEMKNTALFPQKSGKITIEPVEMKLLAQVQREGSRRIRDPFFDSFFNDPFFNNVYQEVELSIESNALEIDVRPLPIDNRPPGFSGAVGSFNIRSSIDNTKLKTNEPITLKYTISGQGNLELINNPDISFPPDFETYEPKVINNIRASASGVTGSRTFEYLMIPRNPGNFTIKPFEFSYFDPRTGKYNELQTEEYNISVTRGEETGGGIVYSGVSQSDIQYIGSDIRHIKSLPFNIFRPGYLFFGSTVYFILLASIIVVFFLILLIWKRNMKLRRNTALVKNRKATRVARKNLKQASEYMKKEQKKEFFLEISRALWGYLSNKFNIPLSELSMETVRQKLSDRKVGNDIISAFIETLEHTEFARFAPGEGRSRMSEIYQEALNIITRIEKELKK